MNERVYALLSSLRELSRAVRSRLNQEAEKYGLSVIQLLILESLLKRRDMSVTDLADQMQITAGPVSTAVDQLVRMGLVDRFRSSVDRRLVVINLSDQGKARIAEIFGPEAPLGRLFNSVFDLPDADLEALLALHQRIVERLSLEEDL